MGQSLDLSSNESINLIVKDKIDDIHIGGTNLMKDTSFKNINLNWSSQRCTINKGNEENEIIAEYGGSGNSPVFSGSADGMPNGEECTLSFYARSEGSNFGLPVYCMTTDNGNYITILNSYKDISKGWTKILATFTTTNVSSTKQKIDFWFGVKDPNQKNAVLRIKNIKLEIGNKATAWSPSPKDIDDRFETNETAITQNSKEIKSKASTEYVNGDFKESIKTQTSEQISLEINALQIGSTNILKDSKKNKTFAENGGYFGFYPTELFVVGREYTVSAKVPHPGVKTLKLSTQAKEQVFFKRDETGIFSTTFSFTGYAPGKAPSSPGDPLSVVYIFNHEGPQSAVLEWAKIETGNKRTDWSPSPEDAEVRFTKNEASIKLNSDKIAANITQISSLENSVLKNTTDIAAIPGSIKAEVNQSIGGNNLAIDSKRTYSHNQYFLGRYKATELLQKGQTYTVQVRADAAPGVQSISMYVSNGYMTLVNMKNDGSGLFKGSFIFGSYAEGKVPSNTEDSNADFTIYRLPEVTGNTTVYWIKIEKGSVTTEWSPSILDPASKLKNSSVGIGLEGIDMESTGHIRATAGGDIQLKAGDGSNSFIQFGPENNPTFNASADGEVQANKFSAQTASIGGYPVWTKGNIIISDTQPAGHGILWLKPATMTQKEYLFKNDKEMNLNYDKTFIMKSSDQTSLPGSVFNYTATIKLNEYKKDRRNVKLELVLSNGSQSISMQYPSTGSFNVYQWTHYTCVFELKNSPINLANTGEITATLKARQNGNRLDGIGFRFSDTNQILTVESNTSASASLCEVRWIQ